MVKFGDDLRFELFGKMVHIVDCEEESMYDTFIFWQQIHSRESFTYLDKAYPKFDKAFAKLGQDAIDSYYDDDVMMIFTMIDSYFANQNIKYVGYYMLAMVLEHFRNEPNVQSCIDEIRCGFDELEADGDVLTQQSFADISDCYKKVGDLLRKYQ